MASPLASLLLRAGRENPSQIFLRNQAGAIWTYTAVLEALAHDKQSGVRAGVAGNPAAQARSIAPRSLSASRPKRTTAPSSSRNGPRQP